MNKNINLYYSNRCTYCCDLIDLINKSSYSNKFEFILIDDIDDKDINKLQIKVIPSIIDSGKIIDGKNAFQFVRDIIEKKQSINFFENEIKNEIEINIDDEIVL
jgi:hypothetical protein